MRRAKQMGFDLDASSAGALQKSFEAIKDKEALMCLEMMKKKAMTAYVHLVQRLWGRGNGWADV